MQLEKTYIMKPDRNSKLFDHYFVIHFMNYAPLPSKEWHNNSRDTNECMGILQNYALEKCSVVGDNYLQKKISPSDHSCNFIFCFSITVFEITSF